MMDPRESDTRTWFDTRRRQLLASAGLGVSGGFAGCETNDDATDPSTTRQQSSPASARPHDHGGDHLGESTPVDRIDVATLSGSRRDGDTVYYDADERGPYPDLEAAVSDVPPGGRLHLGHGAYDVASEGRIAPEYGITVQGTGFSRGIFAGDAPSPTEGTKLVNTGDGAVEEPPIAFSTESSDYINHPVVRDLAVVHSGDSPAVRFKNAIRSLVADCRIRAVGTVAPTGIVYEEESFFARVLRSHVTHFEHFGIRVLGGGYAHEFYSNHVTANDVALETQRSRTIVQGGEYSGQTGIRFFNPHGRLHGGLVLEPGLEGKCDLGIDIDGDQPAKDVQIYHATLPISDEHLPQGVRFGNAENAKLIYPNVEEVLALGSGDSELVRWSSEAESCGLITDAPTLRKTTYTDTGASNPYVKIVGPASNEQLRDSPTTVPTTVDYNPESGMPLVYDGSAWRRPSAVDHSIEE
jgi:hypothetical protein